MPLEGEPVANVGTKETSASRPPGNVEIPSQAHAGALSETSISALLFIPCLSGIVSVADGKCAMEARGGFTGAPKERKLPLPWFSGRGLVVGISVFAFIATNGFRTSPCSENILVSIAVGEFREASRRASSSVSFA